MRLLWLVALVTGACADTHMHAPRGSNNRLHGQGRNVRNNARLFDSQNNNRGGYNVGSGAFHYFPGSILTLEWTSQHQCGGEGPHKGGTNTHCEMIFQYMCGTDVRDGTTTKTIPDRRDKCVAGNCNKDTRFGMHENYDYYMNCKWRSRNNGLFTADQKLKGDRARNTRQNPNGQRRGYECPEERDYYPYWGPSPWKDIAILTTDTSRCEYYKSNSQNVKSTFICIPPESHTGAIPITKTGCEDLDKNGENGKWLEVPAKGIPAPDCLAAPYSRDNHLGNGLGGYPNVYNWTIPDDPEMRGNSVGCIIRQRYNISTTDFDGWSEPNSEPVATCTKITEQAGFCVKSNNRDQNQGVKKLNNNNVKTADEKAACLKLCKEYEGATGCEAVYDQGNRGCYVHTAEVYKGNGRAKHSCWPFHRCKDDKDIQIAEMVGNEDVEDSKARGFTMTNDPNVKTLKDSNDKFTLQLAVNTAQFARTFEDRSHTLTFKERPNEIPADAKIYNLNVKGKRGNIVQTFPTTEYDFTPNRLHMTEGDYIHIQWDGSNDNPRNNAGQGTAGSDRSNIITLNERNYPEGTPGAAGDESKIHGHFGNSYPASLEKFPLLGLPSADVYTLAQMPPGNQLNAGATYVNLPPRKVSQAGTWHYICTRNNAFTNRSQKGKIVVKATKK